MKQIILTSTIFLTTVLTTNIFAQGIYLGAGIGNTFFSSEISDAVNQAKAISENSTAWKIFAGFPLNTFLNIEGGYRSFGSIESNVSSNIFESKTSGWDVEAFGRLQIIILDVFGKAGAMFWSQDATFGGQDLGDSGTSFLFGLGVGVHLGSLGARLEWESVPISGPDNLSMVSLSATIGF